jgi:AraC-like DNA-binding protein
MPNNFFINNYEQRTFNPRRIIALVEILKNEGISPTKVLEGTKIDELMLSSPDLRVSYAQIFTVLKNSYDLSGETRIAFLAGQHMTPASYNLYGYALLSAPTLKDKIDFSIKYQRIGGIITKIDFVEEDNFHAYQYEILLHLNPEDGYYKFLMEFAFSIHLSVMRNIYGESFKFCRMKARYPKPKNIDIYQKLFGCPMYFDQNVNELGIDGIWMHRSPRFPDPATYALAKDECERQLTDLMQGNSIANTVKMKLINNLPSNFQNIGIMAESLSMHQKSLQRKLAAQGTSYRKLLAEARQQLAITYLTKTNLSIDQIASRLGYSDATNFRHAFSSWTGKAPNHYR